MANPIYSEDSIKSLDWREHIRLRPGMYIGKLGNGAAADDGIYVLVKEIIDNHTFSLFRASLSYMISNEFSKIFDDNEKNGSPKLSSIYVLNKYLPKKYQEMINSEFTGITNELDISTITFAQNSIIITKRTNKEKEYFKRGYRFQGCVDNICHFG